MGSSSSAIIGYQSAEQYVSPLSADDMVALSTSLLKHPHWGPHFRELLQKFWLIQEFWGSARVQLAMDGKKRLEILASEVRAMAGEVRAVYPNLADACTAGIALALLPTSVTSPAASDSVETLWVGCTCDDAGEEAVAAFYAVVGQPTCSVSFLTICGDAFGTRAAAASLARCLNVNSSIISLTIEVDGFCGEAAWTAFAHRLTSNATLMMLELKEGSYGQGNGSHVGASLADSEKLSSLKILDVGYGENAPQATLEDVEAWGIMLKHNSNIKHFHLEFGLPKGGIVPICGALLANTTLKKLEVGSGWNALRSHDAIVVVVSTNDDKDILSLAAMLRTNKSLKHLDIRTSGIMCSALLLDHGMSQNTTLKKLSISMDAALAKALMITLAADGDTTINLCPHLKSLTFGWKTLVSQGFPTAIALGNMLASNNTLTKLKINWAPYSKLEWATTILPALASNRTLKMLDLSMCTGLDGELVYDVILELLDINTYISFMLYDIPLYFEGKAQAVKAMVKVNKEYGEGYGKS